MYYNATRKVIPLSGDREIIIETGKLAKQADGSVVVKQGNTMLLATVTAAKEPKDDCDFMPLSVEYKEKYASWDASRAASSTRGPSVRTTRFSCRV
ncbi:MAG: hypothetical protein ACLTTP_07585 [Alistipes ihumii]